MAPTDESLAQTVSVASTAAAPQYVADVPVPSSLMFSNGAVADTIVQVKATAAKVLWMKLVNTTSGDAYLQVFAAPASGLVLGTATPAFAIHLGADESVMIPAFLPGGTGLSLAGTTTAGGLTAAAVSVLAAYI